MNINSSTLFCNCLGVFQGGGCKAIAYVGAYDIARQKGIGFSHVAGTSAGAIFAALIAAGATPQQLTEIVHGNEIKNIPSPCKPAKWWHYALLMLLCAPLSWLVFRSSLTWGIVVTIAALVLLLLLKPLRMLWGLILDYGVNKSANIEATVDKWLHDTLEFPPDKPVRFSDLPTPLSVFSCNLTKKQVHKWSRDDTPDMLVAKAVAASCSIPAYFTPTVIDNMYHVDGCMLINRPDIIHHDFPNYFQALSFKLNSPDKEIKGIKSYLAALINTVIDGADALMHSSRMSEQSTFGHDGVNDIDILVSGVEATDFKSLTEADINKLLEAGRNAMTAFLERTDSDLAQDNPAKFTVSSNPTIYEEDYAMNQVAFWSYEPFKEIIVSDYSLDWVWPLFPTLLSWVRNNAKISVYYSDEPSPGEKDAIKHNAKMRLLDAFGISPVLTPREALIKGYFFIGDKNKCVLFERNQSSPTPFIAKIYNSEIDSLFISGILNAITQPHPSPSPMSGITLHSVDPSTFTSLLSQVDAYNTGPAPSVTYAEVPVSDLWFVKREVRSLKYKELRIITDLYLQSGIKPFSPAAIVLPDGHESLMTPIVVEKHNGRLIVIKGNARCFKLYKDYGSSASVPVFIVESSVAMDNRPFYPIQKLHLSEKKNRGLARLKPIRSIDQAVRPDSTYLTPDNQ